MRRRNIIFFVFLFILLGGTCAYLRWGPGAISSDPLAPPLTVIWRGCDRTLPSNARSPDDQACVMDDAGTDQGTLRLWVDSPEIPEVSIDGSRQVLTPVAVDGGQQLVIKVPAASRTLTVEVQARRPWTLRFAQDEISACANPTAPCGDPWSFKVRQALNKAQASLDERRALLDDAPAGEDTGSRALLRARLCYGLVMEDQSLASRCDILGTIEQGLPKLQRERRELELAWARGLLAHLLEQTPLRLQDAASLVRQTETGDATGCFETGYFENSTAALIEKLGGELRHAEEHARRAVELAQRVGDPKIKAQALRIQSQVSESAGMYEAAVVQNCQTLNAVDSSAPALAPSTMGALSNIAWNALLSAEAGQPIDPRALCSAIPVLQGDPVVGLFE